MLRYGIVGCGGIGATHAEAAAGTDAELVACIDRDGERARALAAEHGCEAATETAAVDRLDIDAVSVCTPNGTHADVAADAMAAGADVLCEKPLDVTGDRIDAMIDAADATGATLAGTFQLRTLAAARRARSIVRSGRLGQVSTVDVRVARDRDASYYTGWHADRDMDGGPLLSIGVHAIDLATWVAGDVASVSAHRASRRHDLETGDTAALSFRFESGACGVATVTVATTPARSDAIRVHCDAGSLRLDPLDDTLSVETADDPDLPDPGPHPAGTGHEGLIADFVDAVREGREPMVPAREARRPADLVFAAYDAAERGESVAVDPP